MAVTAGDQATLLPSCDVGSSGVIYAVIVGAWAVVLVPRWLHRHDEAAAERSRDTPPATHVLSRRRKPAGATALDAALDAVPDLAPRRPLPAGVQARRRRRVSAALLMLATIPAVAVGLGLLPWWAVVAPVLLLAAYLVRVRSEVRRTRTRAAAEAERRKVARAAAQARRRQQVERQRRERWASPLAQEHRAAALVPPPSSPPAEERASDNTWSPVPVPLPTYVTAATAPKRISLGGAVAGAGGGRPGAPGGVRTADQRAVND